MSLQNNAESKSSHCLPGVEAPPGEAFLHIRTAEATAAILSRVALTGISSSENRFDRYMSLHRTGRSVNTSIGLAGL